MKCPTKTVFVLLPAIALLCAGCANRAKIAEAKQFYILKVQSPPRQNTQIPGIVKIRQVCAAAPYESSSFVFDLGQGRFQRDYYNQYIAPPDEQLTELLAVWLREAAVFSNTITGSSKAWPDYILEPHLLGLYCDISEKTAPVVKVAMRFVLLKIDKTRQSSRIVLDRTYRQEAKPVQAVGDDIAKSAGEAIENIFAELTEDLASVK